MKLYSGMDLHSNNTYTAIMDENKKRVFDRRLPNQPKLILGSLEPYRADLEGIVIESTYNWYWLVDLLQENGYRVHLANPSAIQQYSGLKHSDDRHDAFWLAELLRIGLLREGYIYPKEVRPIRDLLRKRSHLSRLRTSLLLSAQNIVLRNQAIKINSDDLKKLSTDLLTPHLRESEGLFLTGKISKELIDAFTRQIKVIEAWVMKQLQPNQVFLNLLTIPGVGEILAMTILLETGWIDRFPKVGNYTSYCRLVASRRTSNDKVKGKGNDNNGNKYLAWAFSEAAEHARRHYPMCRSFYNRKLNQKNATVAHCALARKLSRAAYYIQKDQEVFKEDLLFG
jgi:transposase